MTQSATHHWLSIDCWTCNYEVTKTITDDHAVWIVQSATHQQMFVTACSMDEYAEEKTTEKNLIVRKPKQLIMKDCARRFVLKLYRHEASSGLFATAELLVISTGWAKKPDCF